MLESALLFLPSLGVGAVAGTALWALALYLGFSPVADRVIEGCHRWLQSFGPDGEPTLPRDSRNAALASLASVVPFLGVGGLAHYGLSISLGGSWAISTGVIACIMGGVYELGRQDGRTSE